MFEVKSNDISGISYYRNVHRYGRELLCIRETDFTPLACGHPGTHTHALFRHTHIQKYTDISTETHSHTHTHTLTLTNTLTFTHTHTHTHANTTHLHSHSQTHEHTRTEIHIHTHTHLHSQTQRHTQVH